MSIASDTVTLKTRILCADSALAVRLGSMDSPGVLRVPNRGAAAMSASEYGCNRIGNQVAGEATFDHLT